MREGDGIFYIFRQPIVLKSNRLIQMAAISGSTHFKVASAPVFPLAS